MAGSGTTDVASGPGSYEGSDLEALSVLRRYRDWILAEFRPYLHGRAVEIGAGIGSYSQEMLNFVTTLEAIEPSSALFGRLQDGLGHNPRAQVVNVTAEQWARSAYPQSYDTAVMINVLEHIRDDLEILCRVHRALRPGGHLLLFVPALMALYSPLDRLVGHHRRYRETELRAKVERAGFSVRRCRYFDMLGILPWLVVNRWVGAPRFNTSAARLYDAVGVPVTRAIERCVRPPIGKNLIVVAARTDG